MIGNYDFIVAKQIWKDKISTQRKNEFEKNDIAMRDALIENDQNKIAEAIARRDFLRSIGDKIEQANSIEELKAILP
jgi:hypothetical protein